MSNILDWIGANEAVLSGMAATIAIIAVVLAISGRMFGLFQTDRKREHPPEKSAQKIPQEIQYCRSPAGQRIAWSSAGSGAPLIRSLGWFTNLEMEWDSQVSSEFCQKLARQFQFIRYDGRGMGLSERDVKEFSAESRLEDLEAVVDASGVERFALLGMSEGGSTAIRYAAKHPERVTHLILWGAFLTAPQAEDVPQFAAISRLVPKYWGTDNAGFHQMFTASFLPDGNAAENKLFNELQRSSASAETAFLFLKSIGSVDVREIASSVETPALVLHRKDDLIIPVRFGRELAAQLPNARLVLLEGRNHWFATEDSGVDEIIGLMDDFVQ